MLVTQHTAAYTPEGLPVEAFRLTNASGAYVEFITWGARWVAAGVPNREGEIENVVVGPSSVQDYLKDTYYMGAVIGRMANRIGGARCLIDGVEYTLEANDGANSNHGGSSGFDRKVWQARTLVDGLCFDLLSGEGEGGYPGAVSVSVTYRWSEENELSIDYCATTTRTTVLNLTSHAYFNLSGHRQTIADHRLHLPSTRILRTTPAFLPTGETLDVRGTVFDFTTPTAIGKHLFDSDDQLRWNKGYNHCYLLKDDWSSLLLTAAHLHHPRSGRCLEVETDLPSLLFYTAGYYSDPHTALCLEAQHYPDAPSHPHFPSCFLHPTQEYRQRTVYRFSLFDVNNKYYP